MKKISVIIPTYNGWKTLRSCIGSIQNQTEKPKEIIVIDNNSSDNKVAKIRKYFPRINFLRMDTNTGVTGGRNAGIKLVDKRSEYIFFFDHDMVADGKILEELTKVAESSDEIGIVTPKIYYFSDKKRIWAAGTNINLMTGQVLFRGGEDVGQYNKTEEVQVAPAAMLVKKEVIKKIRKFDSRYFATYEDTDFCFRAKKVGFKTYFAPRAIAFHKLSTDPKDEAKRLLDRAYYVGRNRVLFMKDFGKSFLIFLLFLPIYLIYYLRLALEYHRPYAWLSFVKGTFSGLFS